MHGQFPITLMLIPIVTWFVFRVRTAVRWTRVKEHSELLAVSMLAVYSDAVGAQQCNPLTGRSWPRTHPQPLTLHLHTDWLRVRWPLFPHSGRAIGTCTSLRVTCLLWECRPLIGCAGACGCGLPCGCSEGGRRKEGGRATEWVISEMWNQVWRIHFRKKWGESWMERKPPLLAKSNPVSENLTSKRLHYVSVNF